jgi:hypothetical protein
VHPHAALSSRSPVATIMILSSGKGRTTPKEAVNVVAAHVEKQAEEMVAAGTPQQDTTLASRAARDHLRVVSPLSRTAALGVSHGERRAEAKPERVRCRACQSEGCTGQDPTSRLAGDVALRANAMVAQGIAREDARAWIEEVEGEFSKRLDALLIGLAERQAAEEEPG